MGGVPHDKWVPWVDEPILLRLVVDKILPASEYQIYIYILNIRWDVFPYTTAWGIEDRRGDFLMQILIVLFLTVGLDLDKWSPVLKNRCNHFHNKVDVAITPVSGDAIKGDQSTTWHTFQCSKWQMCGLYQSWDQGHRRNWEIRTSRWICMPPCSRSYPNVRHGSGHFALPARPRIASGRIRWQEAVLGRIRHSWDNKQRVWGILTYNCICRVFLARFGENRMRGDFDNGIICKMNIALLKAADISTVVEDPALY